MHLVLVGMMGSGKTTIGQRVAAQLDRPFYDSDRMVEAREVSRDAGLQILARLAEGAEDPRAIVEAEGLGAIGGGDELAPIVDAALAANADAAEKIRGGNMKAIGPIIGHVMRETKGRADGAEVTRIVREKLGV